MKLGAPHLNGRIGLTMREESLYAQQLQDILEQCGVYEESKTELETLINTSVLRNALTLGTRMDQVYQNLRAECSDPASLRDEADNLRGEMPSSGGIIRANVVERSVAGPTGALREHAVIQRQTDGRTLQQRFGMLVGRDGAKLAYETSIWNQDAIDGEPSRVDIALELPNDYGVEISYLCNEYGEPFSEQLVNEVFQYTHAGERTDVVSAGMVRNLRQFLSDWELQLSDYWH